jgi:1-acyl-sn-glycerol-3-phosphate acyltransferase
MIFQKTKAFLIFVQFLITVTIVIFVMKFIDKDTWNIRKAWARLQAFLIGYKLNIKGEPNIDADIIMINHQSLLDIVVLEANYPKNIAWVAKKEIAEMKFFGAILTLPKMIILDRENRRSLVKLFRDVKDRLEDGRVIGIFPEGTRGDGKKLLEFKSGAKLISEKLDLIVQPVVVVNSRNIVDSQNFLANSGEMTLVYLDTIDPKKSENWYEELHEKMQETLVKELQLLNID